MEISKHLTGSLFDIFKQEDLIAFHDNEDSDGKHKIIVKTFHTADSSLEACQKKL